MARVLMIHPDKCTGCRNCELACSFQQEGSFRPGATRVHVFTWEREGFSVPMTCQQCDDAACVTNLVSFDRAACIGCKMCVIACPFGSVRYDSVTKSVSKCDTCGGSPQCVEFCPNGAVEFADDAEQTRARKRVLAEKLKTVFEEVR
jgi:anaerobic carbon-monoxide dehydrogenase iron sulfur subunit